MMRRNEAKAPRGKKGEDAGEPKASPADAAREEVAPAEGDDARDSSERRRRELVDQLQRLTADFSNYQKRAERRIRDEREEAVSDLVLDLLPVIDNFERAIAAAEAAPDFEAFFEGIRLVHDQVLATLKKHGITPIEAVRQAFDPEHHDAVAHVPSEEHPSGHVMEEIQKGYRFGDRTLRASRVAVSSGEPGAEVEEKMTPDDADAAGREDPEGADG